MGNPIKELTKKEWTLWIASLAIVIVSNFLSPDVDWLTLMATIVGVTSLIFAAKGSVWAQILMVVFSILYGIISFRFRYWGEMVTYLGMSMPMAVWSTVTWIKNPSKENGNEVKIQKLSWKNWALLTFFGAIVTGGFYFFYRCLTRLISYSAQFQSQQVFSRLP